MIIKKYMEKYLVGIISLIVIPLVIIAIKSYNNSTMPIKTTGRCPKCHGLCSDYATSGSYKCGQQSNDSIIQFIEKQ